VDFDALDGKNMASKWLKKTMTMTDSKLPIVTNQKGLTGWPLPSWGNNSPFLTERVEKN
jgi:hypothetical protein